MVIRNSTVPSADIFNMQRKSRLNKGRNASATPSQNDDSQIPDQKAAADAEASMQTSLLPQQPDQSASDGSASENAATGDAAASLEGDRSETPVSGAQHNYKAKPEPETTPKPRSAPSASTTSRPKSDAATVRLHISLPHPAPGTSPTFDHLVEVQSEKAAFRLVLSKALELYAEAVSQEEHASLPTRYVEGATIAKTTRMFPQAPYAVLAKELNRTGLVSDRAMGTSIARRALAAFIANDNALG